MAFIQGVQFRNHEQLHFWYCFSTCKVEIMVPTSRGRCADERTHLVQSLPGLWTRSRQGSHPSAVSGSTHKLCVSISRSMGFTSQATDLRFSRLLKREQKASLQQEMIENVRRGLFKLSLRIFCQTENTLSAP